MRDSESVTLFLFQVQYSNPISAGSDFNDKIALCYGTAKISGNYPSRFAPSPLLPLYQPFWWWLSPDGYA